MNKGTSLVLGVNLKGEVVYCSKTIINILGYTPEEVWGFNFWLLTKDAEFTTECYEINPALYIRKLKCKDGTYKYIQWKDSKYSDEIFLGIGQDVTEQIEAQNLYKKLVEIASDIIFETDKKGKFTFVNPFTDKLLGYNKEEIIGHHFISFIPQHYTQEVFNYYAKLPKNIVEVPEIEFPILKKDGSHLWVSQKVTLNRDEEGTIIGYIAIARDISAYKKIEIKEQDRQTKLLIYSEIINDFVKKQFSPEVDFKGKIDYILKSAAVGSKIDRISYWKYDIDGLDCFSLYDLKTNTFKTTPRCHRKDNPIYFESLKRNEILVANNVYESEDVKEFTTGYFPKNSILSMLDIPILVNGDLHSRLCFETTSEVRNWDTDDINFSRSLSEVVAMSLESKRRLNTELKLAKKTEILSAIAISSEIILKKNNIDEIFSEILSIIGNATNVDRISFFENNTATQSMSIKQEWVNKGIVAQINNPLLYEMKYVDNNMFIEKLSNNKIFNSHINDIEDEVVKERFREQNIKTILIFPIFVKNAFYGSIGFDDCINGRVWSNDDIGVLQILANNLSSAIERISYENLIHESEEKFKLLANNIPGTVYMSNFDDNWSKVYLNDQIEALTGYKKEVFLNGGGFNLIDMVHPDDIKGVLKITSACIKNREPFHIVYRLKKITGEYIWVEEYGDTIIKNGKVEFIEGILLDITEKKQIESEIKAREIAELSNKTKSEFLANMSHEIRTPLNAIIGFTDLLNQTLLDDTQSEYVATVNQSAAILLNVVNDILDFSKVETGKLDLDVQSTNIYELMIQIVDILRFDAFQKNIDLNLKIAEDIPENLFLDAFRLKQILLNLVSNAIKFTNIGQVDIKLDLLAKEEDVVQIKFSVHDTGIGIKKDNLSRIFEPFSQEDSSTTRKYGGTGLGLAISNNLLKLMNSKLDLESDYKKGSNFYFILEVKFDTNPIVQEVFQNNIDEILVEFEDLSSHKVETSLLNKKILIVEDNKINMMLARTLLKKMMPTAIISEAINGKKGLEQFNSFEPDLILMDIQMPILNGYETAVEIRKVNTKIPIIALTAGTIKGEREKCIESGMNDYLSKPINREVFENILFKWLS